MGDRFLNLYLSLLIICLCVGAHAHKRKRTGINSQCMCVCIRIYGLEVKYQEADSPMQCFKEVRTPENH